MAEEQDFVDADPFVDPWWDISNFVMGANSNLLLESGFVLLTESGDNIIL